MISACENTDGCGTRTAFRASVRTRRYKASSVIRRRALSVCIGGEKNKVALGFVEGLNNKIRVIQRRAYGLRDEEYLRLKIITCMLPQI